ncbi:MAG: EamA family transporter [Chitinophagaceae bacterium]
MRKAFLQLHIAILLAGFTGILGRLITLNEGLLVWYRLFFTVIFLWAMYALTPKSSPSGKAGLLPVYVVGGLVALHWVFFYASIKYANVSIGLVCFSAVSFFTAVFDPIITGRKNDIRVWMLGLLVMVGIYLIFHFDPKYKTGIILGVISSALAALFTIFNKSLLKKHSAMDLTRHQLTGGWMLLTVLLPAYLNFFPVQTLVPSWSDIGWLLFLSLFCTVLAYNLSMSALRSISPFTVNLSYNLEPLYGILLAFLLYREDKELESGFYYGMAIIVMTVLIQSWRVWKKKA